MMEVKGIDDAILRAIDEVRAEFGACTAREISRIVRVHNTYVSRRLHDLKQRGLVTFNHVPGSIRRTNTVELNEHTVDEVVRVEAGAELTPTQIRMMKAREAKKQQAAARQAALEATSKGLNDPRSAAKLDA